MPRVAPPIVLTPDQAQELERTARTPGSTRRVALRARIVLLAAAGLRNDRIARELKATPTTVSNWRYRFARFGMAGLADAPRLGRPLAHLPAELQQKLEKITRPPEDQTRWTCRSMAEHTGLSRSRVQRLWERLNIRPHLTQAAVPPVVADAQPRVWDAVGLYLVPPVEALAMCCGGKDHAEASDLSRSDSDHSDAPGQNVWLDDYRDRTLALCAVLNYLREKISALSGCHNHVGAWLHFLRRIDREVPHGLAVHLIVNICPTRKVPEVKTWLRKHPRFWVHFPTSGSTWLSVVERFFWEHSRMTTTPGSLDGLSELGQGICHFMADHNLRPQHYIWCAERARILERIERICPKAAPIPSIPKAVTIQTDNPRNTPNL